MLDVGHWSLECFILRARDVGNVRPRREGEDTAWMTEFRGSRITATAARASLEIELGKP